MLSTVTFSIGWEVAAAAAGLDLDLAAFGLNGRGRVIDEKHFVFFNNTTSPGGKLRLEAARDGGPDLAGGARERLVVELTAMNPRVDRVLVVVSSYKSAAPFSAFPGAFIDVSDAESGQLARYDLGLSSVEYALAYAELYRDGARWLLRATGVTYPGLAEATGDCGL